MPLHKNCELSPPIMSRFDLFFVLQAEAERLGHRQGIRMRRQDIRDETQDQTVAKHIITLHQRKELSTAPSARVLARHGIRARRGVGRRRRRLPFLSWTSRGAPCEMRATPRLCSERYIRLARTYKPKISPEAHALLIKCYKKLREESCTAAILVAKFVMHSMLRSMLTHQKHSL